MNLAFVVFALASAASPTSGPSHRDDVRACTAARLRPYMSPYGLRQPWPRLAELPAALVDDAGEVLGDMGHVSDGYRQTLHVDGKARAAYVLEQGGFAGSVRVYGPLPVAACAASR